MKSGILAAWLVGEGIIGYRCVKQQHRPPMPGELLATSGLFLLLAGLSEWQPHLAVLLAVGLDIAALMNVVQNPALFGPAIPQPAPGQTLTIPNSGGATITNRPGYGDIVGSGTNY